MARRFVVIGLVCGLVGAILVWWVVPMWGAYQHFDGRPAHPHTRGWWAVHYLGWALVIIAVALQVVAALVSEYRKRPRDSPVSAGYGHPDGGARRGGGTGSGAAGPGTS